MHTDDRPALAINTAENRLQVVVGTWNRLLWAQTAEIQARTMQILPPGLESCLSLLRLRLADLDRVAIVRGPGTFTGIRVGLAFALGLARGGGLPLAGLDYLSLLAQGPAPLMQGSMWVCTHARQNLVNIQAFSAPEGSALTPARCVHREKAVQAILAQDEGRACVLGSGIRSHTQWWRTQLQHVHLLDPIWDHPRPEILLRAAWEAHSSRECVLPVYLRPSDAEMQLEHIARERGVDPNLAREAIPEFEAGPREMTQMPTAGGEP
jgi:tRNA threonylcarbamoyl adenosine modification protein YeaZ